MNFKVITLALYTTYLTNKYGFLLKQAKDTPAKMALRLRYARTLLARLNIETVVQHKEKLPKDGQYLLITNHRSIIDPLLVEIALEPSSIYGHWIAKKELYNSFFFGLFTRNAGSILLDRDTTAMASFFKDVKKVTQQGHSVFMFPEGTRNKGSTPLNEFKAGSRLIALKNRIDILPLYISTNADEVLKEAIYKRTKNLKIVIEVGDLIEYRSKTPLDQSYKQMFNIP